MLCFVVCIHPRFQARRYVSGIETAFVFDEKAADCFKIVYCGHFVFFRLFVCKARFGIPLSIRFEVNAT